MKPTQQIAGVYHRRIGEIGRKTVGELASQCPRRTRRDPARRRPCLGNQCPKPATTVKAARQDIMFARTQLAK